MTSSRRLSLWRGACGLLAAGLLFTMAGNRGVAATPPGIDPLEVLDLQVKPNVIIVLDSSGSMGESPIGGTDLALMNDSGDWARSKMYQAKQVLSQVITDNDTKAAFQFGQYTQANATVQGMTVGADRFAYETESWAAVAGPPALPVEGPGASMVTTELVVLGSGGTNALMSFQDITATNNRIFWRERTSNVAPVAFVNCSVTLPVAFTAVNPGPALATAIQTQMNACVRPATAGADVRNTYIVTYNAGTARFTITRSTLAPAGSRLFNMLWATGGANQAHRIMGFNVTDDGSAASGSTGPFASDFNCPRALRRNNTNDVNAGTFDPDGAAGPSPARAVRSYSLIASRFWNGQTVRVQADGVVCGITAGPATNPPTVILQQVAAGCGGNVGTPVVFTWAGTRYAGNTISCNGFQSKVSLRPCDQITPLQISEIGPFLDRQTRLDAAGTAVLDYAEANDGSGFVTTTPPTAPTYPALSAGGLPGSGIPASGNTPIGNSIRDIRGTANDPAGSAQRNWTQLWFNGQAASPGPPVVPALTPVANHSNPKERTVVLFITDGDDTCAGQSSSDNDALEAAYQAQLLFDPLAGGVQVPSGQFTAGSDAASSVQTYLVAFGAGASVTRSNWIAWGGSGMVLPASDPSGGGLRWSAQPTAAQRALCVTCRDAYVAPDADTLRQVLEAIINQGASSGEFTAQQSVTESVFELVAQAAPPINPVTLLPEDPLSPMNAENRYRGLVQMRIQSTFKLPAFEGQLEGFTNSGSDTAVTQWNAGQLLTDRVRYGTDGPAAAATNGMRACNTGVTLPLTAPLEGECTFDQLNGGATPENVVGSAAGSSGGSTRAAATASSR